MRQSGLVLLRRLAGFYSGVDRQREGGMIIVRYGQRVKKVQASNHDATNDFFATSILRGWIADDLREPE